MPAKTGPRAKLVSTTIVTFTRLLAIRIVARSFWGWDMSFNKASPLPEPSRSSHWAGVREKHAISLPLTKPEKKRHTTASNSATI